MIPLATVAHYASQVAGVPVSIRCLPWSAFPHGELGYVKAAGGRILPIIYLPKATCRDLEHANEEPRGVIYVTEVWRGVEADQNLGGDMLVAEHEALHIALQSQDECAVERSALANVWQFVRRFHLAAWKSRELLAGAHLADEAMPRIPYHEGC